MNVIRQSIIPCPRSGLDGEAHQSSFDGDSTVLPDLHKTWLDTECVRGPLQAWNSSIWLLGPACEWLAL